MNKIIKIIMISIIGIGIILFAIIPFAIIFTSKNVRSEFENYLFSKYPQISFNVGKVEFNFINSNNDVYYYAYVTCLNDDTKFSVSKNFFTKEITDSYMYQNDISDFNSKVNDIFNGNDVLNDIIDIHSTKGLEDNWKSIEQMDFRLKSDTNQIIDVKIILDILKENNIYAEHVIFMYEKDNRVFQLVITPKEYNLTEKELASKVEEIKRTE